MKAINTLPRFKSTESFNHFIENSVKDIYGIACRLDKYEKGHSYLKPKETHFIFLACVHETIPINYPAVGLSGKVNKFVLDEYHEKDDTRYGCLPYGFILDANQKVRMINE